MHRSRRLFARWFTIALVACIALGVSAAVADDSTPAADPTATAAKTFVVVIDPGHQAKADMKTEPLGPGSKKRKPRVESGTRGKATHLPESLVNLQVALKLRDELTARGVTVIMVRTTQKVDISNAARARMANAAHADLFIRLHCDGSTSSKTKGILTLVPKSNKWTKPIVTASARAGKDVQAAVLAATGAKDRGITKRGDLTGFNWSKVPVALVEMGLMTNRAEDKRLASPAYQSKLATGMSDGIMKFLAGN